MGDSPFTAHHSPRHHNLAEGLRTHVNPTLGRLTWLKVMPAGVSYEVTMLRKGLGRLRDIANQTCYYCIPPVFYEGRDLLYFILYAQFFHEISSTNISYDSDSSITPILFFFFFFEGHFDSLKTYALYNAALYPSMSSLE